MATSSTGFQDCVGGSVLIFLRWLLRLLKKEQAVLARYERSHPHFFWFLALDAALSIALVVGGYQLFLTSSPLAESNEHLGQSMVSSGALTSVAAKENMDAFWFGPVSGYKYTINDQEPGIVYIFYLPATSKTLDDKGFLYRVKTYQSLEVWKTHTHPFLAKVNTTTISVNKNISIKVNKLSMKRVIVSFKDKPEIVTIVYPKPQTLESIITNVESLKLAR